MQAVEIHSRWQSYIDNHDGDLREQLIMQYAPLVKYVIGRMMVSLPGVLDSDDILGYGTMGLIQAVDRFDPAVGVKFETYAIRRIRGSIIDAIRKLHPLSRETNRRAREIEQAYNEMAQSLGRMPDDGEMAEHLGISIDEFRDALMLTSTTIVSLDAPLNDFGDEGLPGTDQVRDEAMVDIPDQVEREELRSQLIRAIEGIPPRERLLIALYYYEDLTLKEISEVLGVSTSRVCQLHAAAVLKLRSAMTAASWSVGGAR